jgi:hypothetical protein
MCSGRFDSSTVAPVVRHGWVSLCIDTRTRRFVPGAHSPLLVLPHVGTLMTTSAMAWMVAAA